MSHAKAWQPRSIVYFVAFEKALDLKMVGHSFAFFNLREPPPPNPIALIVGSARRLTGEALDRDTREVKFLPKSSKPIPRIRHECHSGRRAESVLHVCTC